MRVIFFGTSAFAVPTLKKLAESPHDIVLVVTTPDAHGKRGKKLIYSPVKIEAEKHNMEIYQPEKLKNDEAYEKIKGVMPDIGIVVSYGKFIPDNLIESAKYKMINIHPSILPKYRGPSPINYALLMGDSYTGVSIIDVTGKMDAGDIYMQWLAKIYNNDNYTTLHNRLSEMGSDMIMCVMENIEKGSLHKIVQDETLATFTKIINKQDGLINFKDEDAQTILNKIRAFYEWPNVYFYYRGKQFRILDAETVNLSAMPSTVAEVNKNKLVIGCKNQSLSIKVIQPESKKAMNIKAFLAGYKFNAGDNI